MFFLFYVIHNIHVASQMSGEQGMTREHEVAHSAAQGH